jgi:hypothetical protein
MLQFFTIPLLIVSLAVFLTVSYLLIYGWLIKTGSEFLSQSLEDGMAPAPNQDVRANLNSFVDSAPTQDVRANLNSLVAYSKV